MSELTLRQQQAIDRVNAACAIAAEADPLAVQANAEFAVATAALRELLCISGACSKIEPLRHNAHQGAQTEWVPLTQAAAQLKQCQAIVMTWARLHGIGHTLAGNGLSISSRLTRSLKSGLMNGSLHSPILFCHVLATRDSRIRPTVKRHNQKRNHVRIQSYLGLSAFTVHRNSFRDLLTALVVQSRHLMGRIEGEPLGLDCPSFADELVRREAPEGLEPSGEIVSVGKVLMVPAQLVVIIVVEALDGGIINGPVHPLHLPVSPGMIDFGEPVLDVVLVADPIEDVAERIFAVRLVGELDAIVGQDRVDGVKHRRDQTAEGKLRLFVTIDRTSKFTYSEPSPGGGQDDRSPVL